MDEPTDFTDFDKTLIASAMELAGSEGWLRLSLAEAARSADLPLAKVRVRFPDRFAVLRRLGDLLDEAAIADMPADGTVRDKLFDVIMRRFDAMQPYRDGILALMRDLPFDPAAAVCIACSTKNSMRWILDAAGVRITGLRGSLQIDGLLGVWLWGVRSWRGDDSADLSTTIAALDKALGEAERFAGWGGEQARPADSPA